MWCVGLSGVLALAAGCETTSSTSDGRAMPSRVKSVEQAPANAPVNALSVLYSPQPADSNANGRPDRISIELYMFARPFPMPVWREGNLTITAYPMGKAGSPENPGKRPFHVWKFTTRDLELGRFKSLIGEGYRFQLSLLGETEGVSGTDLVPGEALDFMSRFEPSDGSGAIWGDGVRTISFQGSMGR
jgi:hypothetical protein